MDKKNLNGSSRHNGAVTLIRGDKVPGHKPPPAQQDYPHSLWPAPDPVKKSQTGIVVNKAPRQATYTAFSCDKERASSTAAQGSDDLMSQPIEVPPVATESPDQRLRAFVGDAGRSWSKLSSEELQHTRGHSHNLRLLVQHHYQMSRQQAELQVKEFFDLHPM